MKTGTKRNELPLEYELSANYLQHRNTYYQSYRELAAEIGISVNTVAKMIQGGKVSMKSWAKLLEWKNKKEEDFRKKNPSLR